MHPGIRDRIAKKTRFTSMAWRAVGWPRWRGECRLSWRNSGRGEPCDECEVVSDDRRPDIGLEVSPSAPCAAGQAEDTLEARYIGLDAGPKFRSLR